MKLQDKPHPRRRFMVSIFVDEFGHVQARAEAFPVLGSNGVVTGARIEKALLEAGAILLQSQCDNDEVFE